MSCGFVSIALPKHMLDSLDAVAHALHQKQGEIVKKALLQHLESLKEDEFLRHRLLELYMEGEVSFSTLQRVLGGDTAERLSQAKQTATVEEAQGRTLEHLVYQMNQEESESQQPPPPRRGSMFPDRFTTSDPPEIDPT